MNFHEQIRCKLEFVAVNLLVDSLSSQRKSTPAAQNRNSLIDLYEDQEIILFLLSGFSLLELKAFSPPQSFALAPENTF